MAVSDYLGSRKCGLHKFGKPVEHHRPLTRRCGAANDNPSVPVNPANRRRDIDEVLRQSNPKLRNAERSKWFEFSYWCQKQKIPLRFSRRLVRRFLKSQKARNDQNQP